MWSSNLLSASSSLPTVLLHPVAFHCPGFPGSWSLRVHVFQGLGFSGPRFFRVQIQVLEVFGFRKLSEIFGMSGNISLWCEVRSSEIRVLYTHDWFLRFNQDFIYWFYPLFHFLLFSVSFIIERMVVAAAIFSKFVFSWRWNNL